MSQLDLYNENTMVVVDFEKEVRLKELLPERWDKNGIEKSDQKYLLLPHEPEVDRPMLAYVKGDKFSLAVDAGYSKNMCKIFIEH